MPFQYADTGRMKAEMVRLAADGMTCRQLAARPGAPTEMTIRRWRRADPLFDQALRQALAVGRSWGRAARATGAPISQDRAEAVVAALRAGASLASLYADPAWPSRGYMDMARRRMAWFDQAVRAAVAANAATRRLRPRAWTAFDAAAGDRMILGLSKGIPMAQVLAAPGMPTAVAVKRWRRARPDFDGAIRTAQTAGRVRRGRAGLTYDDALAARIVEGLRCGESVLSLAGRSGLPPATTIYGWIERMPAFAAAVREACADRADLLENLACERREGVSLDAQRRRLARIGVTARRASRLAPWPGERARLRSGSPPD